MKTPIVRRPTPQNATTFDHQVTGDILAMAKIPEPHAINPIFRNMKPPLGMG